MENLAAFQIVKVEQVSFQTLSRLALCPAVGKGLEVARPHAVLLRVEVSLFHGATTDGV